MVEKGEEEEEEEGEEGEEEVREKKEVVMVAVKAKDWDCESILRYSTVTVHNYNNYTHDCTCIMHMYNT